MPIKLKIEDLQELSALPDDQKKRIVIEYKKGYHFLLFYGKLFVFFALILSLEYIDGFVHRLPWLYRFLIYAALGYIIALVTKVIEINIVAKRVIKDLIKDSKLHLT